MTASGTAWTARTVVQALEAAATSNRTGFRFVEEASTAEPFFTYGGVERATARLAGTLQSYGLKKGDRLALILPDNQDFVFAFLGAIRAGIVPVPIYPPAGLRKLGGYLESTLHIVKKSGAKFLLTDTDIKNLLGTVMLRAPELKQIISIDAIRRSREVLQPVNIGLDDTCFLQFTSGSTSAPKGVVVSHNNIAHNVHAFMRLGLKIQDGVDSGVSWLPLYHDMGLIGFVLGPMFHRCTVSFLPPLLFLKRPRRWLETVSRHRATISFGPNFAYALCCKRVRDQDVEGLDLSKWRVAGCGAEPIRAANLKAFAEKFSPIGFNRRAFMPCYGMAEATLAVSFTEVGTGVRSDRVDGTKLVGEGYAEPLGADEKSEMPLDIVCCGPAFEGHELAIFHPEDDRSESPLDERQVGEIRMRGPSVSRGYFNENELTRNMFAGGWLRTGDVGYMVNGEVYICGRQKEVIIVNGRNYYPQDLEWQASTVEGIRKGNVIAFGTRKPLNDRERVVVAFETTLVERADREALEQQLRKVVRQSSGLSIDDVVSLPPGVLPKTSSGKLMRTKTCIMYETGQLFDRSSAREGSTADTVREVAKSQFGFLRHAVFGSDEG